MTQEPLDPRQQAALDALRTDTPVAYMVIYLDGTCGLTKEPGRAQELSVRTRGVIVDLVPRVAPA